MLFLMHHRFAAKEIEMPEAEGYIGIINSLKEALDLMEPGEARELVIKAYNATAKLAKQSFSSLEIGMDLGRLLSEEERKENS